MTIGPGAPVTPEADVPSHEERFRAGDAEISVVKTTPAERRAGPTVVVTANLHGDECTGIVALSELASILADLVAGQVYAIPSLNPDGLVRRLRRLPSDDQDLNRAFPGDARGGPSDRHAAAIWAEIVRLRPDVLIDLHADAPLSVPYVLLDRAVDRTGDARTRLEARSFALAQATGLTVVHEYPDERYRRFRLDRSLTGAVLNRLGVPALTVEAGPRLYADPEAVAAMTRALVGVLRATGNLAGAPVSAHPSRVPGRWYREAGPRATAEGVLRPIARPGQVLAAGDPVAELRTLPGRTLAVLTAETPGFVLAYAERTHVPVATPICTWAGVEPG